MSARQETACSLALRAQKYNLDDIIETLVSWDPVAIRQSLMTLYFFASNAALHSDFLNEEQKESFMVLQQIIEALDNVNDPKDAKLSISIR